MAFIIAMLDEPPDGSLLVGSDFVLPLAGEVRPHRTFARAITTRDWCSRLPATRFRLVSRYHTFYDSEITLDQGRMEFLVGTTLWAFQKGTDLF